jgi:excisionase family DNA binding protein
VSRWCRSTEAARILGVSRRTVQRLAEAGALPGVRFGRATWWRFDRRALERLAGDAALARLTRLSRSGNPDETLGYSGHEPEA